MAALPANAAGRPALEAAFLTLRLLDEWISVGSLIADADGQAHGATRSAVNAVAGDAETRTALHRIVEAITMLHDPDAQPVLPRVFAYGSMLEHRGQLALAADVYATVSRYVDARAHLDLALDALMKQGFCLRVTGDLDQAERAYEQAGMLAGRARDRVRVLYARIGEAKVLWSRGNLSAADAALEKIAAEAATLGVERLNSIVLHDHASVARLRDDLPRAVRLAYASLQHATLEDDRARVLLDLGNFLGLTGAFDTARTALTILEQGARSEEVRWLAMHNLMDLARREGNEVRFELIRKSLDRAPLPARNAIAFHRDVGRGLALFGRTDEAEAALERGLALAAEHGMHQHEFEIGQMLSDLDAVRREEVRQRPKPAPAPAEIADGIEELLRATAATA